MNRNNIFSHAGKAITAIFTVLSIFIVAGSVPVSAQSTQNIVQIAQGNINLSTLVTALQTADLVNTLTGTGPFTVFAPTNAAFNALPAGVLDALLKPENRETLRTILLYHVVADEVTASEVVTLSTARTVQGTDVRIRTENNQVILNDNVRVTQTDIDASNGVIHLIDAVLVPASVNVSALVTPTPSASIRSGGVSASAFVVPAAIIIALGLTILPLVSSKTSVR